jgi:hypothetical protein
MFLDSHAGRTDDQPNFLTAVNSGLLQMIGPLALAIRSWRMPVGRKLGLDTMLREIAVLGVSSLVTYSSTHRLTLRQKPTKSDNQAVHLAICSLWL